MAQSLCKGYLSHRWKVKAHLVTGIEMKTQQITILKDTNIRDKWATSWQNQQVACAPSEDSDQHGHPPSLIRVFTVGMKKAWFLSYPMSAHAQRRIWSDWADGFVMKQTGRMVLSWGNPNIYYANFWIIEINWLWIKYNRAHILKHLKRQTFDVQATLSQSPGDQTKYFELSVVLDSQFVTSFALYMYTDCWDHHDYNLHVHVFGNHILESKYPLTELLISHTYFEKAATETKECWWFLTSKNTVKYSSITKLQRCCYVHFGYNRTHLTAWLCWLLA